MKGLWSLHLVVVDNKASYLGSAMCFRYKKKKCIVEKLGHNQLEHKSSFGVEILGTC